MKKPDLKILTLLSLFTLFLCVNCGNDSQNDTTVESSTNTEVEITDSDFTPTDWTDATHSKNATPNFDEVFDNSQVKRLDFVISKNNWEAMQADMTSLYGDFGTSSSSGPGGAVGAGGPGGGGVGTFTAEDPIYVPASVYYNGKEWYKVGLRFKGNSSLQSAWQAGNLKLSFKMNFDKFEDEYPQIANQRFYGFKKFSLKNNYNDPSEIREKVAAEIFKNAGLTVSNTAFYTLYVDYGDGPQYFGLYTLVEEVDNTVIDTQFTSDSGNLYKPEDYGASFTEGTFNEDGFEKKTNEDAADWSDIKAVFAALHATTRTTDPATWRTGLDAVFNTDVFLHYLAVNGVIQNWDTYGLMPHNYYLYNNPDNNLLTWIPWDNNEALEDGNMGGALNLDFSNLTGDWPLIEYLYADDVYKAKYDTYLQETIDGPFETTYIQGVYDTYASLVEPYVTTEVKGFSFLNDTSEFYSAISTLKSHAANRNTATNNYLN